MVQKPQLQAGGPGCLENRSGALRVLGAHAGGQHPGRGSSGMLGHVNRGISSAPLGRSPDSHMTSSYKSTTRTPPPTPATVCLECRQLIVDLGSCQHAHPVGQGDPGTGGGGGSLVELGSF